MYIKKITIILLLLFLFSCSLSNETQVKSLSKLESSSVNDNEGENQNLNTFNKLIELEKFLGKNSATTNIFGKLYRCIHEDQFCDTYLSDNNLGLNQKDIRLFKKDISTFYDGKTLKSTIKEGKEVLSFKDIMASYIEAMEGISKGDIIIEDKNSLNSFIRISNIGKELNIYFLLNPSQTLEEYEKHYNALLKILNKESTNFITFRGHMEILKKQIDFLKKSANSQTLINKKEYIRILSNTDDSFLERDWSGEDEMALGFYQRDVEEIQSLKKEAIQLLSN